VKSAAGVRRTARYDQTLTHLAVLDCKPQSWQVITSFAIIKSHGAFRLTNPIRPSLASRAVQSKLRGSRHPAGCAIADFIVRWRACQDGYQKHQHADGPDFFCILEGGLAWRRCVFHLIRSINNKPARCWREHGIAISNPSCA
jgi:hypothetical protein